MFLIPLQVLNSNLKHFLSHPQHICYKAFLLLLVNDHQEFEKYHRFLISLMLYYLDQRSRQ